MLEITTVQKARKFLLVGLAGAFLTLAGDLLIGYTDFLEGRECWRAILPRRWSCRSGGRFWEE